MWLKKRPMNWWRSRAHVIFCPFCRHTEWPKQQNTIENNTGSTVLCIDCVRIGFDYIASDFRWVWGWRFDFHPSLLGFVLCAYIGLSMASYSPVSLSLCVCIVHNNSKQTSPYRPLHVASSTLFLFSNKFFSILFRLLSTKNQKENNKTFFDTFIQIHTQKGQEKTFLFSRLYETI